MTVAATQANKKRIAERILKALERKQSRTVTIRGTKRKLQRQAGRDAALDAAIAGDSTLKLNKSKKGTVNVTENT